jgi:serine kinase of HPr protein (carbohydrate metabolism regulator)
VTAVMTNVHATAIVVGTRGLLFVGPSGIGKTMMAFTCLAAARRQGAVSFLIADDQVLLSRDGDRIIASCPPSIAGLMEIRGSGIVKVDHLESAPIDLAVQVISLAEAERIPPENEQFQTAEIGALPLVRVADKAPSPLAIIGALIPGWRAETPFW